MKKSTGSPFFDEQFTEEQLRKGKEMQKHFERLKKELEKAGWKTLHFPRT
ncbi:MAG TPA: hypothetical protein VLJ21_04315 [Candidatus Binatia bacterium]|nr:hypothetical protein [Candidatus Binatia bacterium]